MALHFAKAVEAIKGGDRVMVTNPRPDTVEEVSYGMVGSGKRVTRVAFRKLIGEQLIRPVADGLFGTELSQTYEWSGKQ